MVKTKTIVASALLGLFFVLHLYASNAEAAAVPEPVVGLVLAPSQEPKPTLALQVRTKGDKWRSESFVALRAGDSVRIRIDGAVPAGAAVRWYLAAPDLSRPYNNANPPGSEGAYRWRGMDVIDYYRAHLPSLDDRIEVAPFEEAGPLHAGVRAWLKSRGESHASRFYHDTLGAFRFEAEVEHAGRKWRTPGAADRDHRGISPRVLLISIREDDSYLGHLRAYFNVPGVFGSTSPQANHFVGVDCADSLMAAFGHYRGSPPARNYSVAMLVSKARNPVGFDLEDGAPVDRTLRWGKDIHPGDFIAVRYPGARTYQHIGALESDADGDGVLSPADRVLHAGPWPLYSSRLDSGMFDGRIALFRPSPNW